MELVHSKVAPAGKVRAYKPRKVSRPDFSGFDRASFMFIQTSNGILLWNRTRSMLNSGHLPSEIAAENYSDYGMRLRKTRKPNDPEREAAALGYFAGLVIPSGEIAPSIFDVAGGEA